MSMRASLGRMTSMTTAVNTMVRTKAMTKLSQWMVRPNMTWSTSAVTTTKPSSTMPRARPTSAPKMARSTISRKM